MYFRKTFLAWALSILAAAGSVARAGTISLADYLQQVQARNEGVKGAELSADGAQMRGHEGDLITAPNLFANATYSSDARPTSLTIAQRTTVTQLQLGVSKLFDFGLQARIYQQIISTSLYGVNPIIGAFGIPDSYIDSAPVLELQQSLWRNGFGSETHAQKQAADAAALATHYSDRYQVKVSLANAETIYWRLALAQELVRIQQDTLGRSHQIREWSARRTRNDLADQSDLLQADAAYRLQQLQLQQSKDDLRSATRAFNSARGVDSDALQEQLQPLDSQNLDHLAAPTRAELRDDVKAAQQSQRVAVANASLGREKNSPSVDLFLNYSLDGRDSNLWPSITSAYNYQFPYTAFGVKMVVPLDFGVISDDRAGYAKEQQAADLLYSRKRFDQDNEWKDLMQRLGESQQRLVLSREIEQAQRLKVEREKQRLQRARTTTFQVLQFETDYNASRVNRLRIENEVLTLVAQMKTFTGGTHDAR